MKEIDRTKEHEEYVIDTTLIYIMTRFDVDEKEARALLFNALAYNIVQDKLMNQIAWLLEEPEEGTV